MTEEQFQQLKDKVDKIELGMNTGLPIALLIIFTFLVLIIVLK